jgi:hypothetical protein
MAIRNMRDLILHLRIGAVMIPALVWIAYLWERYSGVTFVLSKSSGRLGYNSTPEHLAHVLHGAVGATLICVPLFFLLGIWLRQQGD